MDERGLKALEKHGIGPIGVDGVKARPSTGDINRGVLSGVLDWLTAFCLDSRPLCPLDSTIHWGDLAMST